MDGLICLRALWDRIAAWAFILGGGLLVLDAGRHARDAVYVANSFSFLTSGGAGGLAAVAIGCTLLVSAGFHDEWRKLDRIEAALSSRPSARTPSAGAGRWLRAEADRVAGWAVVVAAGLWLAIGSRLVAGALYAPKQVTYVVSGGVAAVAVLLVGLAVLLSADTRDELRKLDRIDALIPERASGAGERGGAGRPRPVLTFLAGVGLMAGAACVVAGWWKAADALRVEPALDGLALALVGAGIVTAILLLTAVAGRGRLVRRAREVLSRVPARSAGAGAAGVGANGAHRNGADATRWTAAGLERFHVAACPVLAGIDSDRRTAVPVGSALEPCLLCDAGE